MPERLQLAPQRLCSELAHDIWSPHPISLRLSPATVRRNLISVASVCDHVLLVTTQSSWPYLLFPQMSPQIACSSPSPSSCHLWTRPKGIWTPWLKAVVPSVKNTMPCQGFTPEHKRKKGRVYGLNSDIIWRLISTLYKRQFSHTVTVTGGFSLNYLASWYC